MQIHDRAALNQAPRVAPPPPPRPDPSPPPRASAVGERRDLAMLALSASLMLALATGARAGPVSGVVVAGKAAIARAGSTTTISQSTSNVAIDWQSFSIPAGQTVRFVQPSSGSVALNRVLGADPSVILGNLLANGRVFLLNPNGVLFGSGSSVSVGGLVASTMGLSNTDFMAGRYAFSGAGAGSVVNLGTIQVTAGGYVALMGRNVSNQGVITARLGSVALAAGQAVTLDVAGDGLLNVSVSQGAIDALVENGGMIRADGGHVLLTAQAASGLLDTVVNNTGVIEARTLQDRGGTIQLLGDMQSGQVTVGGSMDASAPGGGNGGSIETSAAHVRILPTASATTAAAFGTSGSWLIDPHDFTIGSASGDDITGATLSTELVTTSVNITTAGDGADAGDIFINEPVAWTASGAPTTLSLTADRDVHINAAITATDGNFSVCCGRDVNVEGAISVTRGSVLLAGGRDINQSSDITVTDGNLMMCAANNVNVSGAITLTRGTADTTRSLGLPEGLTLSADTDGTGPGIAGGTVVFTTGAPPAAVTAAPVNIYYNPVSYTTPTDYSTHFTLTEGAALNQRMLVFATGGDKVDDGTTTTTLTGLKDAPAGVTLVAGTGSSANFDSADVGTDKAISFTGYTLAGTDANAYALPFNCCGTVLAHTTGTITAAVSAPAPAPAPAPSPAPAPAPSQAPAPSPAPAPAPAPSPAPAPAPAPSPAPATAPPPASAPVPPPPAVIARLPRPVAPILGIVPPLAGMSLPPPPGPLIELPPASAPPMMLVEIPAPVPVVPKPPYAAPLLPPKPYRN